MTPQRAPHRQDQVTTQHQAILRSKRLFLRPLRRSDMGLIELYASDKRVALNTPSIPHPLPPGATDAFVTRVMAGQGEDMVWAMDASDAGMDELVGVVSLKRMDRAQSEVGYWVAPFVWNTGLASEAVSTLLDANPLAARQIFGSIFQDNPASARVLTNAGFDYIGDAETFCVSRNAVVPTWTYIRQMD
ncbi:Protein N-acetyltransferase, RimJ/RimL family [Jannaschia faecimaris]|uniref:Protein N-acetyltransferase, RimJ/RimL family n=1 Tax=Jannaschia faecimaris TaxID=1244108 RepID=A0A1H3T4W6_9RHOB|nr:GNAT family N-acetyltransferase [Jannaschia faecimaris]SDZ45393.1 Protein N-acetyltransferase, RimJ/RimL family [Jannaschia faecimaris]